jgi:hypothetical protein
MGGAGMAFLVRWTDAEGDKAEAVDTARAAMALYAEAIQKEYTGVSVHDDSARTLTLDELTRLAATEP